MDGDAELAALPREILVERARALQTVLRIAEEMSLGESVEALAARFVAAVAAYTRFASIAVVRHRPELDAFEMLAHHGFDEAKVGSRQLLPAEGSLTGLAAAYGELLETDDLASDPRVDPDVAARLSANAYASGACVPVIHAGELLGSFNLVYPSGSRLQPTERGMLRALANNFGVAMAQRIAVTRELELERQARRTQQLESLGVLAGGIAHDFNNLLMGISGNVELASFLAEDAGHEEIVETLTEALAASERAAALTKQLLVFSRGGAPALEVTDSLGRVLDEVANFSVRGTSVRCEVVIEEPLGVVEIDRGQIGQVVQNLVINACQASPSGSVVTVHARRVEPEAGTARGSGSSAPEAPQIIIEVRDEGRGIPAEQLTRIFEPFFTARVGGTGLGLAVSHSIVHRHGGRLSVSSVVGEGTTFTITLPAASGPLVAPTPVPASPRRFDGRALVMDDDEEVRVVAVALLRRLGFEVDAAAEGDAALALVEAGSSSYRVALLDLTVVGGRGGAEIIAELRARSPSTRLIAASGYDDRASEGWDARLRKPFRLGTLAEVLAGVLGPGSDPSQEPS